MQAREPGATKELPTGVFAAALTPMDGHLNPDHGPFVEHCRSLLDAGCHGLGVFGTTGEGNSLSAGERSRALEALLEGGVPAHKLLFGAGSCALSEAVEMCRAAVEVGAGGVLMLPPFYYKDVDDEGLFRFFAEAIERVGDDRLRVYLYHFPGIAGVGFSLPLVGRLQEEYPGVVAGIKDSSGDAKRIQALCREFPDFAVYAGTESLLLDTLRWGGAGCISATANVTARAARRVHDLYRDGRENEAAAEQEMLVGRRAVFEAYPQVPALKAAVGHLTGGESWRYLRPPLVSLDGTVEREVVSHLMASGLVPAPGD